MRLYSWLKKKFKCFKLTSWTQTFCYGTQEIRYFKHICISFIWIHLPLPLSMFMLPQNGKAFLLLQEKYRRKENKIKHFSIKLKLNRLWEGFYLIYSKCDSPWWIYNAFMNVNSSVIHCMQQMFQKHTRIYGRSKTRALLDMITGFMHIDTFNLHSTIPM